DDIANIFPTGLHPEEYGPGLREDLDRIAQALETERLNTELRKARARLRKKYAAPKPTPEPGQAPAPASQPETATGPDHGTGPERDSARDFDPGSGLGGCSRPEDDHAPTPAT
ncbi:hypothetical protein L0U85_11190, partial [Glycomyces sp. L485]